MRLDAKTAKINAGKSNSLPNLSKNTTVFRVTILILNRFDEVNQFIENNYEYYYPPEDPDDYRSDMDDDHDLVANTDSDTLIEIVKFLKQGEAQDPITYAMRYLGEARHHHLIVPSLNTAFYLSHTNRLHPNCMEISYPSYVTET